MLRTERTYLRNLCCGDVDALFAYRIDPRCSRYQRYESTDRAYLQGFVRDYCHCVFPSLEEQHFAIDANGGMIGDLSIFYSGKDNCFTLGITIAPQYQRQGYAFEVLDHVVSRLRQTYAGVDIVALIEKDNGASLGLFEKLGFVRECYAESIESFVFTLKG